MKFVKNAEMSLTEGFRQIIALCKITLTSAPPFKVCEKCSKEKCAFSNLVSYGLMIWITGRFFHLKCRGSSLAGGALTSGWNRSSPL